MNEKKEINQSSLNSTEDIVVVGTTGKGIPVSFQTLQDLYNELTGKTEEIESNYKIKYKIKLEDIEQLYIKVQQAFEQYNITSSNCSVTVFFVKGTKEIFSSFDRFKLFNSSTRNETERVFINFNFMIILPKTKRVQQYEIGINLSSNLGVNKRVHEDMGGNKNIFRFFAGYTAEVSVKYVDYLVAKNFLDIIDEWIKCLPSNEGSKLYKKIYKNSQLFPIFSKNILFLLSIYIIWIKFPVFIKPGTSDLYIFSSFFIPSIPFSYILFLVGLTIGEFIENSIDDYQLISYVSLTRGDELLIEEAAKKNKMKIIKAILGILSSFIVGVAASVVANKIS